MASWLRDEIDRILASSLGEAAAKGRVVGYGLRGADPEENGNRVVPGENGAAILIPGPELTDLDAAEIPEEYRGFSWPYGTVKGIVESPFPPFRNDPQGPLTEEFGAFRDRVNEGARTKNPEWFCDSCKWRRVGLNGKCGPCISARGEESLL